MANHMMGKHDGDDDDPTTITKTLSMTTTTTTTTTRPTIVIVPSSSEDYKRTTSYSSHGGNDSVNGGDGSDLLHMNSSTAYLWGAVLLNPLKTGRAEARGLCWLHVPDQPLTLEWFFSIRGSENFHIYVWLLKDMAWTQDWYYAGNIFSSAAVIWSGYILSHSIREKNTNEIFINVGQFLWLFGNTWWMTGEIHDFQFPDSPRWYPERTLQCGYVMKAALCWLAAYYLVVKPFKLLNADDPSTLKDYDNTGLTCRFPWLFKTWREYENVHVLFWLAKDCAWNGLIPSMWLIFVLPTMLIALDFIVTSANSRSLLVEHAHNCSQFLWVLANAIWAGGEIFDPEHDYPYGFEDFSAEARETARWYSSWMLFFACLPLVALYALWIPYSLSGKISPRSAALHPYPFPHSQPSSPSRSSVRDEDEDAEGKERDRDGGGGCRGAVAPVHDLEHGPSPLAASMSVSQSSLTENPLLSSLLSGAHSYDSSPDDVQGKRGSPRADTGLDRRAGIPPSSSSSSSSSSSPALSSSQSLASSLSLSLSSSQLRSVTASPPLRQGRTEARDSIPPLPPERTQQGFDDEVTL